MILEAVNGQPGTLAWLIALERVLKLGQPVAPRDQDTLELLANQQVRVDLARATVTSPPRGLSYRFMAAEALWILRGDNAVEPLAKHVPRMRQYSDDGVTLAGAYGPPIVAQLPYVLACLLKEPTTRQAVLTIWRSSPAPSKDIPCTVAMTFTIRAGKLHQHVFMRSSDVWLGVPYDMFSFSCVALWLLCEYNKRRGPLSRVDPGDLVISPTSSHLYDRDQAHAKAVLAYEQSYGPSLDVPGVPLELVREGRWDELERDLERVERGDRPERWQLRP